MPNTLLFVFGRLKRGESHHWLVADQKYLGDFRTEPRYRLYEEGVFVVMRCDDQHGLAVRGELYEVVDSCLQVLDQHLCAGTLQTRGPVRIPGMDGAHAYYWNEPAHPGAKSSDRWPFDNDHPAR